MSTAFPGNRQYTMNSLVEELALMERHFRDGSWRECTCNPEKHLPLIAGLASEGSGFAETTVEKQYMKQLREQAQQHTAKIRSKDLSEEAADRLRGWARKNRLQITGQTWTGETTCETCDRSKSLYAKNTYNMSGETLKMASLKPKTIGQIYVMDWLGKAITDGIDPWLDSQFPGALMGYNPSIAVDVGLGIGGALLAYWKKVKAPYDLLLAQLGGYVSTHLYNQAMRMMPAAAMRYVAVTPRGSVSVAAAVPAIPAQGALGKYT